jgi:hypothetical protein
MCHTTQEGGRNKIGPHLHNLFGRQAGTLPGYDYSVDLRASRIVWDAQTLDAYLADPHKGRPGDKMPYPAYRAKPTVTISSLTLSKLRDSRDLADAIGSAVELRYPRGLRCAVEPALLVPTGARSRHKLEGDTARRHRASAPITSIPRSRSQD